MSNDALRDWFESRANDEVGLDISAGLPPGLIYSDGTIEADQDKHKEGQAMNDNEVGWQCMGCDQEVASERGMVLCSTCGDEIGQCCLDNEAQSLGQTICTACAASFRGQN